MSGGNCVGLHPHGPCPPGVGCNAAPDPVGRRVAELEAEVAEQTQIIQALEDELNEMAAELAKVRGYQSELAERCYRKDLELDELRPRPGVAS